MLEAQKQAESTAPAPKKISNENIDTVIIGKETDIPYKMAQCCLPTPADRIVGSIGQKIVTIHRADCKEITHTKLDRRIPARWSNMKNEGMLLDIELVCMNKI